MTFLWLAPADVGYCIAKEVSSQILRIAHRYTTLRDFTRTTTHCEKKILLQLVIETGRTPLNVTVSTFTLINLLACFW